MSKSEQTNRKTRGYALSTTLKNQMKIINVKLIVYHFMLIDFHFYKLILVTYVYTVTEGILLCSVGHYIG